MWLGLRQRKESESRWTWGLAVENKTRHVKINDKEMDSQLSRRVEEEREKRATWSHEGPQEF
jgi:hypothetical protein